VKSSEELERAKSTIATAIHHCDDIGQAIKVSAGDLTIPHRAFMIYPLNKERRLLNCLIEPLSEWAFGIVIKTLDARDTEAQSIVNWLLIDCK
jgi:hypothetical protein